MWRLFSYKNGYIQNEAVMIFLFFCLQAAVQGRQHPRGFDFNPCPCWNIWDILFVFDPMSILQREDDNTRICPIDLKQMVCFSYEVILRQLPPDL